MPSAVDYGQALAERCFCIAAVTSAFLFKLFFASGAKRLSGFAMETFGVSLL